MTQTGTLEGRGLVVFTDLDGTLLDEQTYAHDAAKEALSALESEGIPLVLCSSKTRPEMEALARCLGLSWPLVVENGGALLLPAGEGYRVLERGVPRRLLVRALAEIAEETGVCLQGFSTLSTQEVARLTGLPPDAAALANEREFDEPFLLERGDHGAVERVARAVEKRGFRMTYGGRFHHLTGASDKGDAVRELLSLHANDSVPRRSVGLGNSHNDLSMLEAVDRPIVVPGAGGILDPVLAALLGGAERAPLPGPAGWNAAVLAVLQGRRLPLVAEEPGIGR